MIRDHNPNGTPESSHTAEDDLTQGPGDWKIPKKAATAHADTGATDAETLANIASDVETCVRQADALRAALNRLRGRHLRGESVQEELNKIFQRHDALYRLANWSANGQLIRDLERAVEVEALSSATCQAFGELWSEISWIVPGVFAFIVRERHGVKDWTSIDIKVDNDNPTIADHVVWWGVDEVHRGRVSISGLITEAITRLSMVESELKDKQEEGLIEPDLLGDLCSESELIRLKRICESFTAMTEQDRDLGHGDGEDSVSEQQSDGDKSGGLEELFGSLSAESDDNTEGDDDEQEVPRGFH